MARMYTPEMYTREFLEYLAKAGVTGFDFWLTVQEEGAAIDDRPSVCEMWRKVGIPTFQVGDPDMRF